MVTPMKRFLVIWRDHRSNDLVMAEVIEAFDEEDAEGESQPPGLKMFCSVVVYEVPSGTKVRLYDEEELSCLLLLVDNWLDNP